MTPEPAAERHADAHEHNGLKDDRADSRHGVVAVARNFVEAVLELHLRRSIGRCQERGGRNARRLRRGLIDFEFCVGCCGRYGRLNSPSLHGICSAAQNMEGGVFASGEMLGIAVRNRYHDGLSLAAEGLHAGPGSLDTLRSAAAGAASMASISRRDAEDPSRSTISTGTFSIC